MDQRTDGSRWFSFGARPIRAASVLGAVLLVLIPAALLWPTSRDQRPSYTAQGLVRAEEHWLAFATPGRLAELHAEAGGIVPKGAVLARLHTGEARNASPSAAWSKRLAELREALQSQSERVADIRLRIAREEARERVGTQRMRNGRIVTDEPQDPLQTIHSELLRSRLLLHEAQMQALKSEIAALEEMRASSGGALSGVGMGLRWQLAAGALSADPLPSDGPLLAPVSGRVEMVVRREGELVRPGDPVLLLTETDPVFVVCPVPEDIIASLKEGDPVTVNVRGASRTGVIASLRDFGDFASGQGLSQQQSIRAFRVRVRVDNPDGGLRSGMSAAVTFSK